jgi:pectin methylesterase-like acyl-CoA thioesterase
MSMKKNLLSLVFALLIGMPSTFAEKITAPVLGTDYSFNLADGSIIPTNTDGKSNIDYGIFRLFVGPSNAYGYNGAQHGSVLKTGNYIELDVAGSVTVKIGGCQYSNSTSKITVSSKDNSFTNTRASKTASCSETVDFVYSGAATTLKIAFDGGTTYVPFINVIAAKDGSKVTTPEKNVIYTFNLADGSIIPTNTTGKVAIDMGLFSLAVGSSNSYGYNGAQHGSILKTGNRITLKVAGNSKINIGGCKYSGGNISISSTTGQFDKTSQAAKTANCWDQSGDVVQFTYVGTAGTITLDFTGTNYIPCIQIIPIPYNVELIPWVQKAGTIRVNNVMINLTAGAASSDNATVTVSEGTVISATADMASVRINLNGETLSRCAIMCSGSVAYATVNSDTLLLAYTDAAKSKPYSYKIFITDNSKVVKAEVGKSYSYDFANGSVLPQTGYATLRYRTFISQDGILTINSNTETFAQQFGYHDNSHGAVMFPGNSMDFLVAGNATITINTCQYGSSKDAVFEFTDASKTVIGSVPAQDIGTGACGSHSFSYTGAAGVVTATLQSATYPKAEVYIHGAAIENAAKVVKTVKTDVWDFGAANLDPTKYNNMLSESIINSWYNSSITVGSAGNVLPSFTSGVLSWVGGSNDRLRTANNNLTRYDSQGSAIIGTDTLNGAIYVNSSASSSRYLSLTLSADDEVTIIVKPQNGSGKINFVYMPDPSAQKDIIPVGASGAAVKFVAKYAGNYHVYDSGDKPFYFRVLRKDAVYATVSGNINLADAQGIPAGYGIVLTNSAGKSWNATIDGTKYTVDVPNGYQYTFSLSNANGYIISKGADLQVDNVINHDITLKKVLLYKVSGSITGLGSMISKIALSFTPSVSKIFVPKPVIDIVNATYSVLIEPNCRYTISATGINDYYITNDTLNISSEKTSNIVFELKPTYAVTLNTEGLDETQKAKLKFTFTNLNESGYAYSFNGLIGITLRNGIYTIACTGLDEYPLQLVPTSNLKVNSSATSKPLTFKPVTNWSFDDATITNGTTLYYKGMQFTGTAYNEIAKGHLVIKDAATVKVPVDPGQKVIVTYYYSALFKIENGDTISTSSGSTTSFESAYYIYDGTQSGFVTIKNISGTTYITDLTVVNAVPYSAAIAVGKDKTYNTIKDALIAVRAMVRPNKERVKIMIDPGNYEEMLVVDVPNVSFVNASATPNISLLNNGVDIADGAVRITSYYGHGYNYFSMGTDQKWSADALRINKENGYTNYSNTGSGTTNGSYWNTTVFVSSTGFEAKDIIFENSFNQYISKKESEDIVREWESGGKGTRATVYGTTTVQSKSHVERAAALAFANNTDKAILNKCRVIGRQDSFYGGTGSRIVVYKGSLMGSTDYIFGGMTLICYKTELEMNTSDDSVDVSYITAPQQASGLGYLMYECTITSAKPGTETASAFISKPGYFGRPWAASTGEAVFCNTTIEKSKTGKSMITPEGWNSSLSGTSDRCYEYGTIEKSGENNLSSRVSWSHVLSSPALPDGTSLTCYSFTSGSDGWDPIKDLIASDVTGVTNTEAGNGSAFVTVNGNIVSVYGINSESRINVYNLNGSLVKSIKVSEDTQFDLSQGLWIVKVTSDKGNRSVKVNVR